MIETPRDLVPRFFEKTAQTYDRVVNLTTFGKDKYWKKEILKKISPCHTILDLACGTGILTFQIAGKFPDAAIVGVDVTESYLAIARKKLKSHHHVTFLHEDAEKLSLESKFDCITSSYLPKYCNPETLIKTCLKHLNSDGKIILHDFTYPKNNIVKSLWNLYFIILKVIGYFTPSWRSVFEDLPRLIRSSNWIHQYENAMKRKGMQVEVQLLTWGCSAVLTGTKKI